MNTYVLNSSYFSSKKNIFPTNTPTFRKATTNMRLGYQVINELLIPYDFTLKNFPSERIGLFLGTSHGELEATLDFLKNLTPPAIANPIQFQNSLHHSTLGFLSQIFKLPCHALTTTNLYYSAEDAIDLSLTLLQSNAIDLAIVLACDIVPEKDKELFLSLYEGTKIAASVKSGAAALLICSEDFLKNNPQITPKARFTSFIYPHPYEEKLPQKIVDYYDSNMIELFAKEIHKEKKGPSSFSFLKPDGTASTLHAEIL